MTKTTARVRVTLEIDVPDNWGPDCTMSQVYKQAGESALTILRRCFVVDGQISAFAAVGAHRVRTVEKPVIIAVATEGTSP